jgi:asparagine synthase (glutamine-hydrolysing)
MCGIIGIYDSKTPVTQKRLKAGADALRHRGPDGEGFWIADTPTTGLAHRRLSIIDVETGAQPLYSEDRTIVAVVNGEFYDHVNIRTELQNKGHAFKTASDSEILVHLYEEYGTDCLTHLRGEFSFILFDTRRNLLFAARDRFGIKPLCYATGPDGTLMLASEAKALFAMGLPAQWDHDAFHIAASMQYTLPGTTLFKNVHQLKPGHMLLARQGAVQTSPYWDMDFLAEDTTSQDEQAAAAELHASMQEAVGLRLQADVPICCHLSGGLDSSAILGLATHITQKPVDAFTVSFAHDGYDEYNIARETADQFGAKLHTVHVTQDDLVHELSDAVYHGEGLAINGHLAAKFLLNRAIRQQGFKVALSGEGSDEIFAGYPHLRQDLMRAEAANDAASIEQLQKTLYAGNTASTGVQLAYGAQLGTQAVQETLGFTPSFIEAKAALGNRVHSVLQTGFLAQQSATDPYATFIQAMPAATQLTGRHSVNQSAYLWTKTALANYILRTLGDGMEMAQSIEGRLPFLDHKVFDVARRLPMGMKIKNGVEKHILRQAMRPYITKTVYKRQKHPFMAPPVSLFANSQLMIFLRDHLASADFKSQPFFDAKKAQILVETLPHQSAAARTAAEPVLMMMLTTHLLQKRFGL